MVVPLNIGDATDPENFQLKVDGSALQTAIAAKQDALTSSTALSCGALTVGGAVQVTGGPTVFRAQSGNDNEFSVISGGESYNSKIFLGTPYQPGLASKCCLIAEGLTSYSCSTFHIALNKDVFNGAAAGISDSRFSITSDGIVSIPGQLIVTGEFSCGGVKVQAGGGVEGHIYAGGGSHIIATNSAHGLSFHANRFSSSPAALTISSANAVTCNTSFTSNSDASLKNDVISVSHRTKSVQAQ